MKFRSVFDVIGPVMLGPSSSHTAGAVKIGQIARKLFAREAESIIVHFYGSFAKTYRGHATDIAIIGGLLGMDVADPSLPNSLVIAAERNIQVEFIVEETVPEHPNTVRIEMISHDYHLEIAGVSIGGGAVQITEYAGFPIHLTGEQPTLLILNHDTYGAIARVTECLEEEAVNIGHMEVSRLNKGESALMFIETDELVSEEALAKIATNKHIISISQINLNEIS